MDGIALPLQIDLCHGDRKFGNVVVNVPLSFGSVQRDDDGNCYVEIEPPTVEDIETAIRSTLHVADIE